MKISAELKKELERVITNLKEANPHSTQEEELELYDKAMSMIKRDSPEVFSLTNEMDQLALMMAK